MTKPPASDDGQNLHGPMPQDSPSATHLRGEIEMLKQRERQIAELVGADSPDRIIHELRNVLNELHLLRLLVKENEA